MKKIFFINCLILFFLTSLLTACQPASTPATRQAVLDSLVAAKVKPVQQQLQAICDTTVMQAAQAKADSILKSRKK